MYLRFNSIITCANPHVINAGDFSYVVKMSWRKSKKWIIPCLIIIMVRNNQEKIYFCAVFHFLLLRWAYAYIITAGKTLVLTFPQNLLKKLILHKGSKFCLLRHHRVCLYNVNVLMPCKEYPIFSILMESLLTILIHFHKTR